MTKSGRQVRFVCLVMPCLTLPHTALFSENFAFSFSHSQPCKTNLYMTERKEQPFVYPVKWPPPLPATRSPPTMDDDGPHPLLFGDI